MTMESAINKLKQVSLEYDIVFGENSILEVKRLRLDDIILDEYMLGWFENADPLIFMIPWIVEELELFSFNNLIEKQIGYRYSVTMERSESWNSNWLAIGQFSGDPVFFDSESKKIFGAFHGAGFWEPVLLAEDMKEFVILLYCWLSSLSKYDYEVFDQDFNIKEELLQEFKKKILESNINVGKVNNLLKLA